MTGLNTDLTAAEATTAEGLGLWDVVLGTWWAAIKGTFNTGRTDVDTEMKALNTDLGTEAETTNTGLDLWSGQLNTGWIDLTSEFKTGADNSIDEMDEGRRIGGWGGTNDGKQHRPVGTVHAPAFPGIKERLVQGPIDSLLSALSIVSGALYKALLTLLVGCAESALSLFPVSIHLRSNGATLGWRQRRAP